MENCQKLYAQFLDSILVQTRQLSTISAHYQQEIFSGSNKNVDWFRDLSTALIDRMLEKPSWGFQAEFQVIESGIIPGTNTRIRKGISSDGVNTHWLSKSTAYRIICTALGTMEGKLSKRSRTILSMVANANIQEVLGQPYPKPYYQHSAANINPSTDHAVELIKTTYIRYWKFLKDLGLDPDDLIDDS